MRRFVIATVVILSAAAAAAQDRPAGETRKTLQVLQDVPESQLFLVMNVVAESLGVGCDYCHVRNTPDVKVAGGWQWDNDSKPAKAKGREMMRMVRDLNTSRFGGRLVVTCYTCHRGGLRVANLPLVPPADPTPPAPVLPSAADVIAKYAAAVGANAATRFATLIMEGRDVRPESWYEPDVGRNGPVKIIFKGRDRFRQDFTVPPEPARSQVVNGSSGWASRGEQVVSLAADAIARVQGSARTYWPMKVVETVDKLRVERIERIGGRDAYVVSAATGTANTKAYFFDIITGLLIREMTTIPMTLVPLQHQIEYDDYRSVDGIMLPFMVRTSDDAQYDTSTRKFSSIKHDVPVDDAVFVMPAAQAPAAGERYKSIRVLTDMPATSVIPTMAFISNSLGVTCAHCHTDVYESDEKPMKDKARQMIRMMRAINDTQFGGKRIVTCQTCHNGHAVPVAIPPVENAGWNRRAESIDSRPLPSTDDVLRRFATAVGLDALKTMQSQKVTGTVTRNNGRTAPASDAFELFQEQPRTLRLSTALSHPPEADIELPITFLRPLLLSESYKDLRVVGRDRIVDPVVVLEGTSARGALHRIVFNEESGLIVRRTDEIETPLGNVAEHYDFGDYKRFDEIMIPTRIVWSRADYQVTFVIANVQHVKR